MTLQMDDVIYSSLNASDIVTFEVNGETLTSSYFSVRQEAGSLVCFAKLRALHGAVFV